MCGEKSLVVMDYLGITYEWEESQSLVERLPGLWLFVIHKVIDNL